MRLPGGAFDHTMRQLAPTWFAQIASLSPDSPSDMRVLADIKTASQERLKREMATFLQEASRSHPIIIFLDDLHWADESTVNVLTYLASKFDTLPVLVIATYRPSDLLLGKHPFLHVKLGLQARGVCHDIELEFLSRADIDRYLGQEFTDHCFPTEFGDLIYAKTEGSPLFMTDLLRYLRDQQALRQTDGRWQLAQPLAEMRNDLPESVRSMVQRKLDQLNDADRKLLVAASVQGQEFDSAVLARTLGIDPGEIEDRLEALENSHTLVRLVEECELPDRTVTLRYRFVHALYQNALYASLKPTRRASLSSAVAEALLAHHGERASALAVNLALLFEAARDWTRATDYYLVAARNAVQVFANHEAVALARHGLELLGALPDGAERARKELRLQLTLSIPLVYLKTQASPEALATFIRARELCTQLGEEEPLFSVQYGLAWGYYTKGDWGQACQQAQQCWLLAEARQDSVLLLQSHYLMGLVQSQAGEFLSAREHLEQAIAIYSPEQHQFCAFVYGSDPGVYSSSLLSRTLWYLGYPDQAIKVLEETLRLARQIKHPVSQGLALISACSSYRNYRQPQKVREMAGQAIAIGTEHGLTQIVFAMIMSGWATVILDDRDAGIAQMQRALDAIRATGTKVTIPSYDLLLAEALGLAGRVIEAIALLDEALAIATQITELHAEAEMFRLKGELLLQQDEGTTKVAAGDSAEDCFRQAIAIAQRQHARSWELRAVMSLCRLYQRQGRHAEALPMLAKVYDSFSEGFDTADLLDAQSLLAELSSAADKR